MYIVVVPNQPIYLSDKCHKFRVISANRIQWRFATKNKPPPFRKRLALSQMARGPEIAPEFIGRPIRIVK